MIRALEVYRLTGRPISHSQTQFEEGTPAEQCRVFVLDWPRAELHRRINARVERMFAEGLVDEVRAILARHGSLSRTASQAVGYREVIAHLQGERDWAATVRAVQARTRQFARRQLTWFRSLSECRLIPRNESSDARAVAEAILKLGQASPSGR
jgi:tRNA dimethylallyltransferase